MLLCPSSTQRLEQMAKGPRPHVFLGVVGTFIPVLFFSCSPDVGSWLQLEALLGWT